MAKDGSRRGRRKGSKNVKTLNKEAAREVLREQILASMGSMTEAQIKNAHGIKYLVARNKKAGTFRKVKAEEAQDIFENEDMIVEVWEERPNVQAYTDLMNRAIDKPKEQPLEVDVTLRQMDERIKAARERAGKA